jgi:hypothetical protein
MSRTAWIATAVATAAALGAANAQAQHARGGYYVAPSPYARQVPLPQAGSVWVPGHWEWNGYRNAWVNGYYAVPAQPLYVQPQYGVARPDLDHDGIPDRYDRDRDGDGVPNRYDSRPDNPWRR